MELMLRDFGDLWFGLANGSDKKKRGKMGSNANERDAS